MPLIPAQPHVPSIGLPPVSGPGLPETKAVLQDSADSRAIEADFELCLDWQATDIPEGKAQVSLSLAGEQDDALKKWEDAGKGSKIPLNPASSEGLNQLKALTEHIKTTPTLNPEQKKRALGFFAEFAKTYANGNASKQPEAYKLLNQLLTNKGITQEQLSLIAKGEFTAGNLLELIRSKPPGSLIGSAWDVINPPDDNNAMPVIVPVNNNQQLIRLQLNGQNPIAKPESAPEPKLPAKSETQPTKLKVDPGIG